MPIFTNVDGQWKKVPGPPAVRLDTGWKNAQAVYARAEGQWRLIWPAVEPVITVTPQTPLFAGDTATTTGKVEVPVLRNNPAGQVTVTHKLTSDTSWSDAKTVPVAANGSFTVQHTILSAGKRHWRVVYEPSNNDFFITGQKISGTVDVGLRAVGELTKGTLTLTSAAFSWTPVPGAERYKVYRDGTELTTVTASNVTDSGLAASKKYKYKVKATASPATGEVEGDMSTEITAEMGKAAVPRVGSATYGVRAVRTGTFQRNGTYLQGTWLGGVTAANVNGNLISSHPNNGNFQHYGVMQYDSAAWRKAVDLKHGDGVAKNLTISGATLYMSRTNGGAAGMVKITLYQSNQEVGVGSAWPAGSVPNGVASPYEVNGLAIGGAGEIAIDKRFASEVLKEGSHKSLYIKSNSFDQYAVYFGINSNLDAARLTVTCSWDFIAEAEVSSKWV